MAAAVALARFALSLNDAYPFPPDANHRTLEDAARGLLDIMGNPARVIRSKAQ